MRVRKISITLAAIMIMLCGCGVDNTTPTETYYSTEIEQSEEFDNSNIGQNIDISDSIKEDDDSIKVGRNQQIQKNDSRWDKIIDNTKENTKVKGSFINKICTINDIIKHNNNTIGNVIANADFNKIYSFSGELLAESHYKKNFVVFKDFLLDYDNVNFIVYKRDGKMLLKLSEKELYGNLVSYNYYGGVFYLLTQNDKLSFALAYSDNGDLLWKNKLGGELSNNIILNKDVVIFSDHYVFDIKDGNLIRKFDNPVVANAYLLYEIDKSGLILYDTKCKEISKERRYKVTKFSVSKTTSFIQYGNNVKLLNNGDIEFIIPDTQIGDEFTYYDFGSYEIVDLGEWQVVISYEGNYPMFFTDNVLLDSAIKEYTKIGKINLDFCSKEYLSYKIDNKTYIMNAKNFKKVSGMIEQFKVYKDYCLFRTNKGRTIVTDRELNVLYNGKGDNEYPISNKLFVIVSRNSDNGDITYRLKNINNGKSMKLDIDGILVDTNKSLVFSQNSSKVHVYELGGN